MKEEKYIISGMSCAACQASVQRVVSRLEGVVSAEVNLITGKMTVRFDEEKVGMADFVRRASELHPIYPKNRKIQKKAKPTV